MLDAEAVVDDAVGNGVVVVGFDAERIAGLGPVDVVPEQRGLVAGDQLVDLRIGVFAVGFGFGLDGLGSRSRFPGWDHC